MFPWHSPFPLSKALALSLLRTWRRRGRLVLIPESADSRDARCGMAPGLGKWTPRAVLSVPGGMMAFVIHSSDDLHPRRISGYDGGPFTHDSRLLDERLFWLGHLCSCAYGEEAEEALFGPDWETAGQFHGHLYEAVDWPLFSIPLRVGHRFHVVYRTFKETPVRTPTGRPAPTHPHQ